MENEFKYKEFLVRDFLCDEYFQDWVMHPDAEKNRFWQQWILQNPEKEAVIALAIETLSNLDFKVNRPSPEKARESLQKTWAIIDGLETAKSSSKESREISITSQEQIESDYLAEEKPARQKPAVFRLLIRVAIAASVLLIIGLGWKFLVNSKHETAVVQTKENETDSVLFVTRHEVNTTGKEKRIQLPDGSLVVLANNSEITFHEPFTNTRDISLIGKAYFKVAKDKTKPFAVTSGAISTTAVGTEFTVTAFKKTHQIIVRLYEGKVVVKAVDTANKRMKKHVFLLPGQQLIYGDQTTVKVQSFKMKATAPEQTMNEERVSDNPSIPENAERPYFMFNNQSLGKTLDDLAVLYNTQIIYNKQDVKNIYFTGKYNRSESLEAILNRIGIINNLTITRKDSAFVISR
jgi:transmembrane sensor